MDLKHPLLRTNLIAIDAAAEAKNQISLALPIILTNLLFFFIPLVSLMFAGHLGQVELAAANLGTSFAAASGFDLMVGLSGALETLCGQGFGCKMYRMMGVYLQSSCILSSISATVISILWWYSDIILRLLHQDPQIAELSAIYLRCLIPGLFAQGFLQHILRFLQTQSAVTPVVVCALLPLLLQLGIVYALLKWTTLGLRGPPLAASISLWISLLMLTFYVLKSSRFRHTWKGFSFDSFSHLLTYSKLALPSAAMVCVNAETVCYMIAYGLSAAISTRVGNELGAGNPGVARQAARVGLQLNGGLAVCVALCVYFGHDVWAASFNSSPLIMKAFSSITPLLTASVFCDFLQGILSGVARGCGWQHQVVLINLGSFYVIGIPLATILAFKFQLHAKGLWIGLTCGLAAQTIGLLLLSKFTKWRRIEFSQDC